MLFFREDFVKSNLSRTPSYYRPAKVRASCPVRTGRALLPGWVDDLDRTRT
jgi:hypothetical protein